MTDTAARRYVDLHQHCADLGDCGSTPEEICRRQKELGAEGFAVTQHGALSCVETMRRTADKYGLKYIPGIETYYKAAGKKRERHLVILCRDAEGYRQLSKAVSEASGEDGFSHMDDRLLQKYFGSGAPGHGHVIATSACVGGVICRELDENAETRKQEESIRKKIARNNAKADNDEYKRLTAERDMLLEEVEAAEAEKKEVSKKTSRKFIAQRKKIINKAEEGEKEALLKELEEDIKKVEAAEGQLEAVKEVLNGKRRQLRTVNSKLNAIRKVFDKTKELEREIEKLGCLQEGELAGRAVKKAEFFSRLFGEDGFYLEIQNHGFEKEKALYRAVVEVAKKTRLPLIASNDCHLVTDSEDERLRRQILRSKRFDKWAEEEPGDRELYIKDDAQMEEALGQLFDEDTVEEALANTVRVFNACNVVFKKETHYPKFPLPEGYESADQYFDFLLEEGIKERFPKGFPKGKEEVYKKRVEYEKGIIKKMGYVDYHLIERDMLIYASLLGAVPEDRINEAPLDIEQLKSFIKENRWSGGFSTGPGRGSAGGCLICYLLGITHIDPLVYGLPFERFLNPYRVSMPDIDSDLSKKVRGRTIEYLKHRFGEKAICGIMTINTLAPKGAIRDAAKYYGLSKGREFIIVESADGRKQSVESKSYFLDMADRLAKLVPAEPGTRFDSVYDADSIPDSLAKLEIGQGRSLYEILVSNAADEDEREVLRWARCIEGAFVSYGAHAAGIIISDNSDVSEYTPLRWNSKLHEYTTQCDMVQAEENGLLKFDLLGLKTLDVITDCKQAVKERTGIDIDPIMIPLDDPEVYEKIFQKGFTKGVFQVEKEAMTRTIKSFGPTKFEDLALLISMYRPGPLQFIDQVMAVKHGEEPEYLVEETRGILEETYSAIIYQEQVMQIFQELAGYSLGEADNVRRYMSKKKMDKLVKEKERFVEACVQKGIDREKAVQLFDQMVEFARYCFNKSHGVCYARLTYITAWFKTKFPAEFYMAAMNRAKDSDKVKALMQEASEFGIKVLPPDINMSEDRFVVRDGNIIFGLGQIKNVGAAGKTVISERKSGGKYENMLDLILRTNIDKQAVESMIKAGAMDSFCSNRAAMKLLLDVYKQEEKRYRDQIKNIKAFKAAIDILSEDPGTSYENFIRRLKENGVPAGKFKDKVPDMKKLPERMENAKKKAESIKKRLSEIDIPYMAHENIREKMIEEADMLGNFVTIHPMDGYPDSREFNACNISDLVDKQECTIYGFVSNIQRKRRKKDGHPLLFFDLEDRSGKIPVNVFSKTFDEYEDLCRRMEDWTIITAQGRAEAEETPFTDDEGNPVYRMKFTVRKMSEKDTKKETYYFETSSYIAFHLYNEKEIVEKYADENGHPFIIVDKAMGTMRMAKYKVSDKIESIGARPAHTA